MGFPLTPPKTQWVDENGDPLVGGTIEFLNPSTGVQKNTYPTRDDADAQTNANANPVTLDSNGQAAVFLEDGEVYRAILKDADGVTIWDVDDIEVPSGSTAAETTIADAGGYFTATNVEAALQELGDTTGASIIGIADAGGNFTATNVEDALAEFASEVAESSGAFSPTYVGFSATPTGDCIYIKRGDVVTLEFPVTTGTSSSTAFSITNLPSAIRPSAPRRVLVPLIDNGSPVIGSARILAGTISFASDGENGTFTGSGDKGFPNNYRASITYELTDFSP